MDSKDILSAVEGVTAKWTKQRKSEERNAARAARRRDALTRYSRTTIREVAWDVMEEAYMKASGGGRLVAHARQVMYAARPTILERADCYTLNDNYFTQTLLPDYLAEHPEQTAQWNIAFDARGHLHEPHTGRKVPLGTLDVQGYLQEVRSHRLPPVEAAVRGEIHPTCGPKHRYGAILFCEKEGFFPLFEQVNLAGRYDIGLMSTKGMSNTAARRLVDTLCAEGGVKLLVLHDFDKSGFSILGTLQRDTRRYTFSNSVDVVDLGIRLADVKKYGLQSEPCTFPRGSNPTWNLRENGATVAEIAFLCGNGYRGRRVELNAFTSDALVEWIEGKLVEQGVRKVIPGVEVLERAYRRAVEMRYLDSQLAQIAEEARRRADAARVSRDLARRVKKLLKANPAMPWDWAVGQIVTGGDQ